MGVNMEPLPWELQALITNTTPQHRIEIFPGEGQINSLYCYDGRAMYLGCCQGVCSDASKVRRVEGEDILPEERGRARVEFTTPRDWRHVGLLPVKDDAGNRWLWPPGDECETWASLQEIRFARKQGWEVRVLEKIAWPEDRSLDLWADRLSRLYLSAKKVGADELAACYRSIALYAIGRLHNLGYRDEDRTVPIEEATFEQVVGIEGGEATIRERKQFDKRPEWCHPEWSAAIWANARMRVTRAMLEMDRSSLVGCRGDAIYTSSEWNPNDQGRCGDLRLKGQAGPLPWPSSWRQIESAFSG
jgi:hypothetical protein